VDKPIEFKYLVKQLNFPFKIGQVFRLLLKISVEGNLQSFKLNFCQPKFIFGLIDKRKLESPLLTAVSVYLAPKINFLMD